MKKYTNCAICIFCTFWTLFLSSCAPLKCRNCAGIYPPVTARFDRSKCRDLPEGRVVCKEVVFIPQTVKAGK